MVSEKRSVVVLSDPGSDKLPIMSALQSLDYHTETFPSNEFSSTDAVPHAVVIAQDSSDPSELGAIVHQARATWDAPILVACHESIPVSASRNWLELGAVQVPNTLAGEDLQYSIANACTIHQLASQLRHHRGLLQAAPVGVFEIDNGQLTYVNDYLLEQTGYTMEELRELPIEDLLVPDDRPRFARALAGIPTRSSDAPPNVYRFVAATGQTFVGEVRSMPTLYDGKMKIEGTIRDITQETRISQLHRIVLELTEVILAAQDIDKILQLVLDTIVEYSGFHRALLTLYDLSWSVPFEGPVYKTMSSGLTPRSRRSLRVKSSRPSSVGRRSTQTASSSDWHTTFRMTRNFWMMIEALRGPLPSTDGIPMTTYSSPCEESQESSAVSL